MRNHCFRHLSYAYTIHEIYLQWNKFWIQNCRSPLLQLSFLRHFLSLLFSGYGCLELCLLFSKPKYNEFSKEDLAVLQGRNHEKCETHQGNPLLYTQSSSFIFLLSEAKFLVMFFNVYQNLQLPTEETVQQQLLG